MKLCDVFENMLSGKHPEYDNDEVAAAATWFRDGNHDIIPIENHKFVLVRKANSVGLFRKRDGALLGWVLFENPVSQYGLRFYPLVNIQILPPYRNTLAAWLLINGVRGVLDLPVVIDNTLFSGGQQLLIAMSKRASMPNVSVIDKTTGTVHPFDVSKLKIDPNTAFLLEHGIGFIMVECAYPGGFILHAPDWLSGLTEDIE